MKIFVVDQGLFEKMKREMEWISFVGELKGFISRLQVNENEAGKYNDYEGKWDEDFIDWMSRNVMVWWILFENIYPKSCVHTWISHLWCYSYHVLFERNVVFERH